VMRELGARSRTDVRARSLRAAGASTIIVSYSDVAHDQQ